MNIECYRCARAIPHGEPYVNVTYSIERTVPEGGIEVELAEAMLSLCADCAPSKTAIAAALRAAGLPVAPAAGDN